jgi:hypothetical protein
MIAGLHAAGGAHVDDDAGSSDVGNRAIHRVPDALFHAFAVGHSRAIRYRQNLGRHGTHDASGEFDIGGDFVGSLTRIAHPKSTERVGASCGAIGVVVAYRAADKDGVDPQNPAYEGGRGGVYPVAVAEVLFVEKPLQFLAFDDGAIAIANQFGDRKVGNGLADVASADAGRPWVPGGHGGGGRIVEVKNCNPPFRICAAAYNVAVVAINGGTRNRIIPS